MREHIRRTIDDLKRSIRKKEEDLAGIKRTVNLLCEQEGEASLYVEADIGANASPSYSINPDTFYGQALNTSIREILEMNRAVGKGPASVREIYDMLVKGGYQFTTTVAQNAQRGLRISLGKSSQTFHKLPNGSFGLKEWYPDVKDRRSRNDKPNDETGGEGGSNDEGE